MATGDRYIAQITQKAIMENNSPPSQQPLVDSGQGNTDDNSEDEPRSRRAGRPPRKRLSEILIEIAADNSRSDITVADLQQQIEGRARAALIFLFAFPNVFPAPGLSAILGLPLLYLTSQMMLARIPWLPKLIAARGVPRPGFAATVERVLPFLRRAERMLQPRWTWLVSHRAERPLGALALVLAIVVTLPIPLGNMLPAFAICLIALGVLERDGLWASLGLLTGLGALALSATVAYAMLKAVIFVLFGALS
ncbi:MAG: exopolysaccharide biosynthesis protein [Parahaliea sp.]